MFSTPSFYNESVPSTISSLFWFFTFLLTDIFVDFATTTTSSVCSFVCNTSLSNDIKELGSAKRLWQQQILAKSAQKQNVSPNFPFFFFFFLPPFQTNRMIIQESSVCPFSIRFEILTFFCKSHVSSGGLGESLQGFFFLIVLNFGGKNWLITKRRGMIQFIRNLLLIHTYSINFNVLIPILNVRYVDQIKTWKTIFDIQTDDSWIITLSVLFGV